MRIPTILFIATLGLALTALPASAQVDVTYGCGSTPGHAEWPAGNPVWTFDFLRPSQSTGRDGSGLEIRNVFYNGQKVFERAHTPVLNVEYDGGGCGCFRDWSDSEAGFAVTNSSGCVAVADPGTVETTCDSNQNGGSGGDTGSFTGVAFEEFPGELVVTTHMSAGWYRYRMKWHFYADGRIWPEYSFSASSATCTSQTHRHHVYWRFDFDLQGTPNNDVVTEFNTALGTETTFTNEVDRTWGDPNDGISWLITDSETGTSYRLAPSAEDLLLPVDGFSKADALVLRYNASEIDDGGGSCAINYSSEQNGESLNGEDIVFWYRSGASHEGGNPWECDIVGPTLQPVQATADEPGAPADLPNGYVLESAYPNPFNPSTTIRFQIAEAQNISLGLYDALGRKVADLYDGFAEANRFETVRIDGSGLPSGTYTVRLEGESIQGSTRVVLIK